jgi:N-acyl-D-aspartate/D-glutamate deacylase
MLDLRIDGGLLVDGTGDPGRHGDVGIRDGRIAALGDVDEPATRTIDATGLVVAPGFIDVHTHYDAQVLWDSALGSSTTFGVTTVLGGNCGFTLAPLMAEDRDYMVEMLAKVEGMPLAALQTGLPGGWTSIAEYLNLVETGLGPNAGFLVGHSALRRAVMHAEATEREATGPEIAAMARLLDEGLSAGGLGLSSTWSSTHVDHDGRPVPSRAASLDELLQLCAVVGDHPGTNLEFIAGIGRFSDDEVHAMTAMSVAAKRTLNWNMLQVFAGNLDVQEAQLAASDHAAEHGGRVVALTLPSTGTVRLGFQSSPIYEAIEALLPFLALAQAEQLRILSDPAARHDLGVRIAGCDPRFHQYVAWETLRLETHAPSTATYDGKLVGEVAAAEGRDPWDVVCDTMVADEMRTGLHLPDRDGDRATWERRCEVWRDPRTLIGASDAGAHLDMITSFAYPAWLLGLGVRRHGLLPVEEAVRMLTDDPAQVMGIVGRGRLEEGYWADVVLFDPATIGSGPPRIVHDLPGGAARVHCEPQGIPTVIVNGIPLVDDGEVTGARPGRLLRSGRDTKTVLPDPRPVEAVPSPTAG